MSIDERIRHLAREEAGRLLEGGRTPAGGAPDTAGLQQQITDLHEHLHHAATAITKLEERVDSLEKEQPTARRATRKTGGTATTPE